MDVKYTTFINEPGTYGKPPNHKHIISWSKKHSMVMKTMATTQHQ